LVLGRDDPLPVPLVHVAAVVVVEEVVLANGPHVRQETLADPVADLPERGALPFRGGLDDLGVDRVLVVVVGYVELDRPALAVAVEHVVDARLDIDYQRYLHHVQVELPAETLLDVVLDYVDGFLGLSAAERRLVVVRQDLLEVLVVADARPGKVGLLVARRERHGVRSSYVGGRQSSDEGILRHGLPARLRPRLAPRVCWTGVATGGARGSTRSGHEKRSARAGATRSNLVCPDDTRPRIARDAGAGDRFAIAMLLGGRSELDCRRSLGDLETP